MTSREQVIVEFANWADIYNLTEADAALFRLHAFCAFESAWQSSRIATIDEVAHHYFRLGNIALATDIQRLKDKK